MSQYLQGIPQSRLEEWMHSLPANKMPKLNTTGEAYRETQLLQVCKIGNCSIQAYQGSNNLLFLMADLYSGVC